MVLAALAYSAAGCGKPVLRVADASLGDYYTDQEFKKLRRDQRDEYCAELARQDSAYTAELLDAREALDALRAQSHAMRAEGDSLFALASRLDARIQASRAASTRSATGDARDGGGGRGSSAYVVRPGDSLWRISRSESAYGSGALWRRIYAGNRGRIRDPNLIFPGQELTIPR